MKLEKGDYGYLAQFKKKRTIITGILLIAMAAVIGFGYWRYHTMKTIFTVIGILFAMPLAKVLSGLLVVLPFRTLLPVKKNEIEQRLTADLKEQMLWDMALSSQEKVRYFPCVIFSDQTVLVLYEEEKKQEVKEAEKYFRNLLKNNCHRAELIMVTKEEAFLKKAAQLDWKIGKQEEAKRIKETILVYEM